MRIKIFLKKALSVCLATIIATLFYGCFDLGDFSDDQDYYDSFDDVILVFQNPEKPFLSPEDKDIMTEDYSVRDYFYNGNTGNDFAYGDPSDDEPDEGKTIPKLPYVYMAIPVNRNLTIDSLVLWFNSDISSSLEVAFYIVDELPDGGDFSTIMLHGDSLYVQEEDSDGNPIFDEFGNPVYKQAVDGEGNLIFDETTGEPVYEKIEFSDPKEEYLVSSQSAYLKADDWVSIVVEKWGENQTIEIKEDQYILIRFLNNGGMKAEQDLAISFMVTNLLVRAVA